MKDTQNGESGVTRLVSIVCKSAQERGCEKSERFMSFSTYLKDEFEIASVPLKPFLGNRFNILFVNGLGEYCLDIQGLNGAINCWMQFIGTLRL